MAIEAEGASRGGQYTAGAHAHNMQGSWACRRTSCQGVPRMLLTALYASLRCDFSQSHSTPSVTPEHSRPALDIPTPPTTWAMGLPVAIKTVRWAPRCRP